MVRVGEIGERALIDIILTHLTPMPKMPIPFWDDVMAFDLGNGKAAVLNTDMLVWETDVLPGMTNHQVGRKVVVMNFSDLGAKGVRPQAFLASLGIPRETKVGVVEEIVQGFEAGARENNGYVIGGDTNESSEIIISGTALGVAPINKMIKRKGAEARDILATTGVFGDTAAAFKILLEEYEAPERLRKSLLESVYNPIPRVDEGVALAETGVVSASIDSSDGLAISLHDLSRSSSVGFRLDNLPISPNTNKFAELHGINPVDLSLYGGEEYELIFTVKPSEFDKAEEALRAVNCEILVLGEVTVEKKIVFIEGGVEKNVEKEGWDHFTSKA